MSHTSLDILPKSDDFLVLPPAQQVHGYRNVNKLFAHRDIRASNPKPMTQAECTMSAEHEAKLTSFMRQNNVAGLLVLKNNQIFAERYGLGLVEHDRWTTMSTVKSMTSLLVGAAIQQGAIQSADDLVVKFLPELKNTAYDTVSIRDLLTMSSGTNWTEDYDDLDSHVSQYSRLLALRTPKGVLNLLKTLKLTAQPGTRWSYNTGDTYLIGAVLVAANGGSLAQFMEEQIWNPCGMEFDAFYTLESENGLEIAGSRAGMALRDFGKIAQLVLNDGVSQQGHRILPQGWITDSAKSAFSLEGIKRLIRWDSLRIIGYGYSWWLDDEGGMWALGHCGQRIYINRNENMAVIQLAAYPHPFYETPYYGDMDARLREYVDHVRKVVTLMM